MADITCKRMIQMAYRRCGVLNRGAVMSEEYANSGLEVLQRLWNDMIGGGLWGQFTNITTADAAYTPAENVRVVTTNSATVFTIPVTLDDPDTGLNRAPRDGSIIQTAYTTLDTPNSYIYDAQTQRWISIRELALEDPAPFYGRYGEGLTAMLAVLLADEYGNTITQLLARQAATARLKIASKYDQERASAKHCYM